MPDFLSFLFGEGAEPLRRTVSVRLTVDSDGRPIIEPAEAESISLSRDGSLDRVVVAQDRFYHCGCNAQQPLGGRCGEPGCNRLSCTRCFSRCTSCHKPLCLEHLRNVLSDGRSVPVCARCDGALRRKRVVGAVVRGLLSPFVAFDERRER